jgi:hypothetical protein
VFSVQLAVSSSSRQFHLCFFSKASVDEKAIGSNSNLCLTKFGDLVFALKYFPHYRLKAVILQHFKL